MWITKWTNWLNSRRNRKPYRRQPLRFRPSLESFEQRLAPANVPILSGHFDNLLTGWNSQETALNPTTVNDASFGKLFNYAVDGYTYAQPLYVPQLSISGLGGGTYNVVFAATEHDSLYALNADAPTGGPANNGVLWQRSFIDPANGINTMPAADTFSSDIVPEVGITGTPVIDPATNTLYVVAKTKELRASDPGNAHYVQKLYAIDITTGNIRGNNGVVTIGDSAYIDGTNTFVSNTSDISVPGTGAGSQGGILKFDARKESFRMSAQLVNGTVYLAFASHGDNGPYHGWIIGYKASDLSLAKVFNTSPNGSASGIWESGGNLGFDAQGNLYFSTGNGFGTGFNANSGGTTALGANDGGFGYQNIGNSLAVTFKTYDGSPNSSTGLGMNGSFTGQPSNPLGGSTGINFNNGAQAATPDVYQVSLSYSGTTLTETIKDLTTNSPTTTFTYNNVNIQQLVGGNTAYVGFTGGTGGLNVEQDIKTWTFNNGATTTINHGTGFTTAGDLTANGGAALPAYPAAPNPVGAFQYHQDIGIPGDPVPAGTASFNSSLNGGTYTLTASGTDIGFKANQYDTDTDRFQYVYNPMSGTTGSIVARVASMTGSTNPADLTYWTKAVVQIRNSLDPQAANVDSIMSPHNVSEMTWRDVFGGTTGAHERGTSTGPLPGWIRLDRSGDTFTGFWAVDTVDSGGNHVPGPWQQGETHTLPAGSMGSSIFVGLGLCSHANGQTATATFDHVSITGFTARTLDPVAQLTGAANNQAGSIFFNNKVDVTNFNTTFTFQMRAGSNPIADGMTFTIQNANAGKEYSETVMKLSTTGAGTSMPVVDYFTPHDWPLLDSQDADLGSGGTMLLPDAVSGGKHLMVETGKTGRLYLIDRDNMGKINARYDQIVQIVTLGGTTQTPGVWGNPAFFQDGPNTGLIFYWGSSAPGQAFRITNGVINPSPISITTTSPTPVAGRPTDGRSNFPGTQPSISSNGTTGSSAIMWALRDDGYGINGTQILYAYNAEDLTKLLWSSTDVQGRDAVGGTSVKFTMPIVSNGHVYAGSNGSLAVYGLLAANAVIPADPASLQVTQIPPTQGGDTQLQLAWNAQNDATLFKIERSTTSATAGFTQVAEVSGTQTSFTDTGLTPLTHYWYRIKATNQKGDSTNYSNVGNAFTHLAGAKLTLTNVASLDIDLSWSSVLTSDSANKYSVERSTDNFATFSTIASNLPASQTTYADTTPVPGTTYQYRVHAFNVNPAPADESFSNVVTANDAPVDIESAFPDGIQNVDGLQFNGSASFSPTEHLIRLTDDIIQAGSVFTTNRVDVSKFTSTFWVRVHEGTQPSPADGFTFTIQAGSPTALGAAASGLGYAGIGKSVAIKFGFFNQNTTGLYTNGQSPSGGTAINPSVVNLGDQHRKRIDISYDASTLQLRVTITDEQHDGGPTSVSQTYNVDIPSIVGGGAYAGLTGGTGGFSANGTGALYTLQDILGWVFPPTAPAAPDSLTATVGSSGDITLSWKDRATGEDGYLVQRSLDSYHFDTVVQLGVGANSYHDADTTNNTIYFYRVGVFNALGTGFSNTVVVQPVGLTINHSDLGGGFGTNSDLQANGNAKFLNPAPAVGTIGIFTAHQDIGSPGDPATPGSVSVANGVYTLQASGDDIYNNADAFHFVYKPLHGDGQITARITNLDPTMTSISDFTKAGVMIRETLATDAREVSLVDTRDHSFRFQRRSTPGGSTDRGPDGDYPDLNSPLPPPLWLRLRRQGNVFTAFWSRDGNTWTRLDGPQTINMATDVFIGLALTAHNNDGRLDTTAFDNVSVNTAAVLTDGGTNEAGSVFAKQRLPVTGTFSTSFVMNINPVTGSGNGLAFVLQADSRGAGALGGSGAALGYGVGDMRAAISPSVALKFDLFSQGSHASTTGLYINGATGATGQFDMTSAGIDFQQKHTYQVDLTYDGLTLRETIKDLVSDKTFTASYTINLRSVLGADTAFAGITAGTSAADTAWIAIESWTGNFNSAATPPHLEGKNVTPQGPQSGELFTFTVSQRTPFGQTLGYRGMVHFSSSDPYAILQHPYTFTAADAGSHTFTAALLTVGPQTITVTDDAGLTDTFSLVVTPTSFVLTSFPSPTIAGDEHSFTVTARDFLGNTTTGYVGTVHFTSTDPKAVLPDDYTFTPADAGMHTFSVTLKTAGTQSITVADKLRPANATGTQSGIQVDPGVFSSFVLSGFPSSTQAGVAHDLTVTVKDAYGNIVTGYSGTIQLSSNDGQMDLSANPYTFDPTTDAGVHTFSVTLKTAGTRSITVDDGTVQATQTGIHVTPGVAVGFQIIVLGNALAGMPVDVFVTAVDAYGNTGAIYTGTVHVSSDDFSGFDYTFLGSEHGNHVFSVTFNTTGSHFLRVEDKTDSSIFGEIDGIPVA
jgi:hypothetical protein